MKVREVKSLYGRSSGWEQCEMRIDRSKAAYVVGQWKNVDGRKEDEGKYDYGRQNTGS